MDASPISRRDRFPVWDERIFDEPNAVESNLRERLRCCSLLLRRAHGRDVVVGFWRDKSDASLHKFIESEFLFEFV